MGRRGLEVLLLVAAVALVTVLVPVAGLERAERDAVACLDRLSRLAEELSWPYPTRVALPECPAGGSGPRYELSADGYEFTLSCDGHAAIVPQPLKVQPWGEVVAEARPLPLEVHGLQPGLGEGALRQAFGPETRVSAEVQAQWASGWTGLYPVSGPFDHRTLDGPGGLQALLVRPASTGKPYLCHSLKGRVLTSGGRPLLEAGTSTLLDVYRLVARCGGSVSNGNARDAWWGLDGFQGPVRVGGRCRNGIVVEIWTGYSPVLIPGGTIF